MTRLGPALALWILQGDPVITSVTASPLYRPAPSHHSVSPILDLLGVIKRLIYPLARLAVREPGSHSILSTRVMTSLYSRCFCLLHPSHQNPPAGPRHPGRGRGAGVPLRHGGGRPLLREVVPQWQGVLPAHSQRQPAHCCVQPARPGGGCEYSVRAPVGL